MGSVATTVISGYKKELERSTETRGETRQTVQTQTLNTHESRGYITKYRTVTIEQ